MVILSAINYFIDMNYMIARLVGIICFFGLSAYFLIAFSKNFGKRYKENWNNKNN